MIVKIFPSPGRKGMAMAFIQGVVRATRGALWLMAACVLFVGQAFGQTDTTATATPTVTTASQTTEPRASGTIRGIVADKTNTAVAGASILLTRADSSAVQQTTTDDNGQYAFGGVAPGAFNVAVSAAGFASQSVTGELHAGEAFVVPPVTLAISTLNTEINVTMSHVEVAEAQIKEEEKQRGLGFVPNHYQTSIPHAPP